MMVLAHGVRGTCAGAAAGTHASRECAWCVHSLIDGDFAVGVDVGVFGELVSVAVDVVRVSGARGGYGGDPRA